MATSLDSIDSLSVDYPELFEDRGDPLTDDFIITDVSNPGGASDENIASSDTISSGGNILDDFLSSSDDVIDNYCNSNVFNNNIMTGLPRGRYPGASTFGGSSPIPPIDALAFYLPFHYYPKWWGIYLTFEGVYFLTSEITKRAHGHGVPWYVARDFAKVFLFRHEFFHHKVETLATRMECVTRTSCYKTGIEDRYQATKFTSDWIEESLANAYALKMAFEAFSKKGVYHKKYLDPCMLALIEIVNDSDEGYRQGTDYDLGDFLRTGKTYEDATCEISEVYLTACFPHIKSSGLSFWQTANRMMNPIANIISRTNYIISKYSKICRRLPLDHYFAKPNKIIKAIKNYGIELKLVSKSGKGSHQKYKVMSGPCYGHTFELPRKPQCGTIKDIWKQATGESLSLTRLKAII